MRSEQLTVDAAVQLGATLPYAYERYLSRVFLGCNTGIPDWKELLEARYFDSDREVRIFLRDGSWCGCCLTREPDDHELMETHNIENEKLFGRQLTVCRTLAFDEDGQAYVCASRLAGWKEETSDA